MISRECFENKWFDMKYIGKYLSGEILLTREWTWPFTFLAWYGFFNKKKIKLVLGGSTFPLSEMMQSCIYYKIYDYAIEEHCIVIVERYALYTWIILVIVNLSAMIFLYQSKCWNIYEIKVITKLPNSEQSYKGKVKTHNYINRQNQSTTGKL